MFDSLKNILTMTCRGDNKYYFISKEWFVYCKSYYRKMSKQITPQMKQMNSQIYELETQGINKD